MANGILIVDKPSGWTSQDVATKLRGVFHERRVGHGGTLDPMATGVLPIFLGRATRAVEFFESAEKEYIAGLRLGTVTNTQDIQGEVLQTRPVTVTREELAAILPRFTGPQEQIPPMFSAIKIGGKKLYELARQGKEIQRAPRPITIFSLELMEGAETLLRVRCSKGTYVRTLCHDIGAALGCGGCMESLRRTKAGIYGIEQAHPLEEILSMADPGSLLLPVDSLFSQLPAATLSPKEERLCRNGNVLPRWSRGGDLWRIYGENGEFLMIGQFKNGCLYTKKSFFEVN